MYSQKYSFHITHIRSKLSKVSETSFRQLDIYMKLQRGWVTVRRKTLIYIDPRSQCLSPSHLPLDVWNIRIHLYGMFFYVLNTAERLF